MEKVKRRRKRVRRHRIRNLPIKWSFMLYVVICAVIAITLSLLVAMMFSEMQSNLYYSYERKFLMENNLTEDAIDGAFITDGASLAVYRSAYDIGMSAADEDLYDMYNALSVLSVPIVCLLCILITGFLFYNRKLKAPLQLVDSASKRIAAGDLDFTIAYENRNEMGRLASSFETMRAALQENQQEMWRMMEARKQLNAAFAHDLRTPLTVLKGYAEYLRTYVPQQRVPEEKLVSTIDLMHGYILRLEGYTASMSAMQKLEEVRPVPQTLAFSTLSQQLHGAADMLRGPHHLHFESVGSGEVTVDPNMIVQVLENLVSNASRYAAKEIRVLVCLEDGHIRLSVSDDGPGFPASVLRKGLSPYNHKKDEDVHSEHYGLGLYICSVLCQRHFGGLTLPPIEGQSYLTAAFAQLQAGSPR